MPTTSSYAEANITGTDISDVVGANCKYDSTNNIEGPLNPTCQSTFKYFDSSDRTPGVSERYMWMKEGDEYKFPTEATLSNGCPRNVTVNGTIQNANQTNGFHYSDSDQYAEMEELNDVQTAFNNAGEWKDKNGNPTTFTIYTSSNTAVCNWGGDNHNEGWGKDETCDGSSGSGRDGHYGIMNWKKINSGASQPVKCKGEVFWKTDGNNQIWGRILKT